MLEPVLILFIWISISVLLPEMFPCTLFECTVPKSEVEICDKIKLVGTRMVDNQSTPAHRPHILHSQVD